jgi:hypothetical protein
MGDNRPDSQDSRFFGPIERDLIVGRAFVRYFPLDRITLFDSPPYPGLEEAVRDDWSVRAHQPRGGSSALTQVSIARS